MNRFPQIPRTAAVEIRRRQFDVAKWWHAEYILVIRRMCNNETALVGWRQDSRSRPLDHSERRVRLTTYVNACMAGGAALVHEQLQAFFLICSQSIRIATEVFVEGSVWREKGPLERGNGRRRVRKSDRVCLRWKGILEQLRIAGNALQRFHDMLDARSHLQRVLHRAGGLLLQVCRPAVPKLRLIENGVEYRRRVPAPLLRFVTDGRRQHINAAKPDLMAGVAADVVA